MQSKHYVCEMCNNAATICHHKEPITPENIVNINITLSWSNLMCLCHDCHQKIHGNSDVIQAGLIFDEDGNLMQI